MRSGPKPRRKLHADWWDARIARQREIDASIAAKAEFEYLYDKPYEDRKKVRVAGPFTVESLSPHRVLGVDENDELIDPAKQTRTTARITAADRSDFAADDPREPQDRRRAAGAQGRPHRLHLARALARRPDLRRRPLQRKRGRGRQRSAPPSSSAPSSAPSPAPDLVAAAREAGDAGFDVLIACAFNYDAHASRVRQARPHPRAQGAHERRPAHGRGPEERPARATCS